MTFRRLVDADLPLLHGWLNEPGVVRWWEGEDVSWDAVVADYGEAAVRRDGARTEHWLALVDDRPIGWIQCYALVDYADDPDDADGREWVAQCWAAGVDREAAGIDYLVGEVVDRGRGVGTTMISTFVDEVVFGRHPAWTQACADPHVDNPASWRALERAGFGYVGTTTSRHGAGRLCVRDRTIRP